jgi:hypothetical protein
MVGVSVRFSCWLGSKDNDLVNGKKAPEITPFQIYLPQVEPKIASNQEKNGRKLFK